jgi:drug/metabolite transporter (DMT)-like permease
MKTIYLYSIAAGILWGVWPLLMNRSGVSGIAATAIFTAVGLTIHLPLAFLSGQMQKVDFNLLVWFVVASGILAAIGTLCFNTMLAKATPQEVGILFLGMLMVQIASPSIYHLVQSGDYSLRKLTGIIGAFVVVFLLR